ncbi:amino acid adenylation domain-containing protein [Kosakonia quasisacchari]|uniref:Amino acid adenylation domain-containing protein n=1 Tax=Kosakonia quasisacchari TaxID=2529380 RepID=A0A4R0HJM7_9ENTR|nr:non-ribosomal peptide synthetase [Kosakonia quasisacchari]TCC09272.1 amino acid adenylation domain-containing protein [Kosakonia quasisacchari]
MMNENNQFVKLPKSAMEGQFSEASYAQKRLWFLNRMDEKGVEYNINYTYQITGGLDIERLQGAINKVIQTNESLRSKFFERDGIVYQQVLPARPVRVFRLKTSVDVNDNRDGAQTIFSTINELSRKPYNLEHDELIRVYWLAHNNTHGFLFISMHHIISDFTSWKTFHLQVKELYSNSAPGLPITQRENTENYTRYSAQQRDWMNEAETQILLQRYADYLSNMQSQLTLPKVKSPPQERSTAGALTRVIIDDDIVQKALKVSKQHKISPFMLYLSVFTLLLKHYCVQDDIAIATMPAGRFSPEYQSTIGLFVNTSIIRTVIDGTKSFSQLLKDVRENTLTSFEFSNIPYDAIVKKINPERSLLHNPLVQVAFVLHHSDDVAFELPGVNVESIVTDNNTAKFDLTLCVFCGKETTAVLEYSTDLFDHDFSQQLLCDFLQLVEFALAAPSDTITTLLNKLNSVRQMTSVLERAASRHKFIPVHEMVLAQASRTPDHPALIAENETISYANLETLIFTVANKLISYDLDSGARIGILLKRSMWLPVAILGVLHSGYVFVPLDPDAPAERLRDIVDDACIDIIITEQELRSRVTSLTARILEVANITPTSLAHPAAIIHPEQGAYILYTSGSTGKPKGVLVPHRGIANRVSWACEALKLNTGERVLYKTPATFDVSVGELFWPLVAGASLVILPDGEHKDPACIVKAIRQYEVTACEMVPTMLQLLLEHPDIASCTSLRFVLCNGEVLPHYVISKYNNILRGDLYNLYGPTEASVNVSWWNATRGYTNDRVSIGRAIDGVNLYILDKDLTHCPPFTSGDLYISGVCLALGYLNRPRETAEKFIPDPFQPAVPGTRMYKTGDIARVAADGLIEFVGRNDSQVKIRGYRIELGEVEHYLLSHPDIHLARVTTYTNNDGIVSLAGYYVSHNNTPEQQVRDYLTDRCPSYLIPGKLVRTETLPVTISGKLDVKAFPEIIETGTADDANADDATISKLRFIWSTLLESGCYITLDTNFFSSGGHSLLAIRLLAKIYAEWGVEISVKEFFTSPTIRYISGLIDRRNSLARISNQREEFVLSAVTEAMMPPVQHAIWLTQLIEPESIAYNVAIKFTFSSHINIDSVRDACVKVISNHDVFHSNFVLDDLGPRQKIHAVGQVKFHALSGDFAEIVAFSAQPFCCPEEELYRIALFRIDNGPVVALWIVHHAIFDNESSIILRNELQSALSSSCAQPAQRARYIDYSQWRTVSQSVKLAEIKSLSAWKRFFLEVKSVTPELAIRTNTDTSTNTFDGARYAINMPDILAKNVFSYAEKIEVTAFSVLLAACARIFKSQISTAERHYLRLGTIVSDRRNSLFENTIGCFSNYLPLMVSMANNDSFEQTVHHANAAIGFTLDNQDVLQDEFYKFIADPADKRASHPFSGVVINFRTSRKEDVASDDIAHDVFYLDTAKFDAEFVFNAISAERIYACIEFNTSKYSTSTIAKLADSFLFELNTAIESIVAK